MNCSGACVAVATDSQNCGACAHACAPGQGCAGGQCGCATGQTLCGSSCVDTSTSGLNCGTCGHACGAGQTCSGGVCMGGTGTGGTGGGAGGAGGAAGAGGADGGMVLPMPTALTCGAVSIPAADVILGLPPDHAVYVHVRDPGRARRDHLVRVRRRGQHRRFPGGPGPSTPGANGNAFAVDATTSGPCNSGGSLKVSSPGNTGYGIGFGVNLVDDVTPGVKGLYDAKAAGYTGFGFFAKCQNETDFVFVKTVDKANDADVTGPTCSYSGAGTICNEFGQKNETVVADWTYFKVYFADTLQDWDGGTITATAGSTR